MGNRDVSSRNISLLVISEILKGRHLQEVLNEYLSKTSLSKKDKNLTSHLVYGYFRLRDRLLFILKSRIRSKFEKLPQKFILPMCVAIYEILYLDKIPDYATVSWYVEYIKRYVNKNFTSLANGVLRSICREKQKYLNKKFFKNSVKTKEGFFSIYYSMPIHLVNLLIDQYGYKNAEIFLEKSILKPYIGIRINKRNNLSKDLVEKFKRDKNLAISINDTIFGFFEFSDNLESLEQMGVISRRSVESQKIMIDLKFHTWNFPLLDICAGTGGKSIFLMQEDIKDIWASDIDFHKLRQFKKEIDRLKLQQIPLFALDATKRLPLKLTPNTILIDAPCSGLGVVSRRPDIKWRIDKDFLNNTIKLQEKILDIACSTIPVGGKVVYITCTWNREENEMQIKKMIQKRKNSLVLDVESQINFLGEFREFFYGAVLVKKSDFNP